MSRRLLGLVGIVACTEGEIEPSRIESLTVLGVTAWAPEVSPGELDWLDVRVVDPP